MDSINICVSVIVPFHNRFDLVNESIKSVYEQTYRPIELIVVDDLSDELFTPKISSEPDFEVKIIRHEENKGPGASRETGRLAAHGDYIAYLDSDDLWHTKKLEKQVEMLQAHPETGMCYCKTALFSDPEKIDLKNLRSRNDQSFDSIIPTLFFGRPWSTSACLWSKNASNLIGPWFPGWSWEDREYEYRAGVKKIKICHVSEVLCYVRQNECVERLSKVNENQAAIKRFDSIVALRPTIISSKNSIDRETKSLFTIKVFRPLLIQLFDIKEYEKARIISEEMLVISPKFSKIWLFSLALRFFLFFPKNFMNKQLFKKLWIHLT